MKNQGTTIVSHLSQNCVYVFDSNLKDKWLVSLIQGKSLVSLIQGKSLVSLIQGKSLVSLIQGMLGKSSSRKSKNVMPVLSENKNKKKVRTIQALEDRLIEVDKGIIPLSQKVKSVGMVSNNTKVAIKNLWLNPIFHYGAHIGHKPLKLPVSRGWLPRLGDYLIGDRNRVATINSHLAIEGATKGLYLSAIILRRSGHILIVDTRGEASSLGNLIETNNDCIPASLSFSGSRWTGGSLTNWDSISIMVRRCAQISKQFDAFITQNRIHIPRYEKMRQTFPGFIRTRQKSTPHCVSSVSGGIRKTRYLASSEAVSATDFKGEVKTSPSCIPPIYRESAYLSDFYEGRVRFKHRPDLLWVLNPNENRHIIEEAERLNIPTIGVVDSNTNLSTITISILLNNDAPFWSNKLLTTLLTLSKCLTPFESSQSKR